MKSKNISIIIPTYNSASFLTDLLTHVYSQSISPIDIIIIDSESTDGTADIALNAGCHVHRIKKQDFNHGGTRNLGVSMAQGDIIVFMTQDALLADDHALQALVAPFNDPQVGAVCGRQLPHSNANPLASHARFFNYPATSCIKTKADIPRLGIKVPFISNSFAAYRKSALQKIGGFPEHVILSEDMCAAARMILASYSIAYAGDATVFHSHNYTPMQEFHRYFDIGAFHSQESWIQETFGGAGGEGLRYVRSELKYAYKHGWYWVFRSLLTCMLKLVGYKLGKWESFLPIFLKRKLSMNKTFWS
ncbi:MAG: glycosyltransferase family 2 protein [Paludibacter sp.]|nr:glycosyltransferase family 2 protein [Paludibacter sp.]